MAAKNKTLTEEKKREIGQVVRKQISKWVFIVLSLLGPIAGVSLWEIYNHVQKKVENLVAQQFEEPRIKEIVENTAKNRASALMSEQINPEVIKFKGDMALKITKADEKLSEMDAQIRDANAQIQKLNNLYYISYLASRAKNDSKSAYLDLKKYVDSKNIEENAIANDNLKEIIRGLLKYRFVHHQPPMARHDVYRNVTDMNNREYIGDDPTDSLANDLISYFNSDDDKQIIMGYISKKPKEEIFKAAIKVFESDSLSACAIFCGILSGISEEKADFLDLNAWTEICKKQVNKQ
jgi:type I site-specific restriction-modification system R (restriction) subunit